MSELQAMDESGRDDGAVPCRFPIFPPGTLDTVAFEAAEPPAATYLAGKKKRPAPAWSGRSLQMFDFMGIPVDYRDAAPYRREFVDQYEPNHSSLLPLSLADELHRVGRWDEPLPRGDLSVGVMAEFLVDFCWSSSRLEGCRHTRDETARLFRLDEPMQRKAARHSTHARLLANHKAAMSHMVREAPTCGLTPGLVRDLHGTLMQGLLDDDRRGHVRHTRATVTGTTYQPSNTPVLLEELLERIVSKAALVRNPVEAAFFLWIQIAYLQAFTDGNKRTGRLCANVPLLLGNCTPLTFDEVDPAHYVTAMLGVYERNDVSVAADLFAWLYRRSMQKYLSVATGHLRDE